MCGLFAEVARRLRDVCGRDDDDDGDEEWRRLFASITAYMDGCVVEARWRLSGKLPGSVEEEFYDGFRLRTSAARVLLDLCR